MKKQYKRRVCVSISKDVYEPADEVTDKYGFAPFVKACLILYASKNPVFLQLILEQMDKKND